MILPNSVLIFMKMLVVTLEWQYSCVLYLSGSWLGINDYVLGPYSKRTSVGRGLPTNVSKEIEGSPRSHLDSFDK